MIEWLAMGGYAGFVWGSYGVVAIAIAAELVLLRQRRRRALTVARGESGARDGA